MPFACPRSRRADALARPTLSKVTVENESKHRDNNLGSKTGSTQEDTVKVLLQKNHTPFLSYAPFLKYGE